MTVTSFAQGGVAPQPFRIAVEETTLLDLKRRLDATRWPDEVSIPVGPLVPISAI